VRDERLDLIDHESPRVEDDDREVVPRQVLLELEVRVAGDEDISGLRQGGQQIAIPHPLEPEVLDVPDVQSRAIKQRRELTRDVLVDDDAHGRYPVTSRISSTSSIAATACARDTEG
jgi:hypothetical protein